MHQSIVEKCVIEIGNAKARVADSLIVVVDASAKTPATEIVHRAIVEKCVQVGVYARVRAADNVAARINRHAVAGTATEGSEVV
jgi:hypothetical protein